MSRLPLDRLRLLALAIGLAPLAALPALGLLWLWQQQHLPWWLGALGGCALLGYALHAWLDRRARALLTLAPSGPAPHWPPSAQAAWERVEALAAGLDPDDWPLDDGGRLLRLGRHAVEAVAQHYHPQAGEPVWELSVPHLLRIVELAARDLGRELREQIPWSERVSIGDLLQARRWQARAQGAYRLWRAGRLLFDPLSALLREAAGHLQGQAFGAVRRDVVRWLLQEYVRRTGRYAIEVYGGRLLFDDADPRARPTPASAAELAAAAAAPAEPLRILVLGQTKAGKSSLVNALCGAPLAAVDVLPVHAAPRAYRLEREGLTAALVRDGPGLDALPAAELLGAARDADLILWVCAAHRADRAVDRRCLDALRADAAAHPERRAPPLVVVLAHIDRLRPAAEWQPPYDLRDAHSTKARHIAAALAAVAADLVLPPADIVPVCLAAGRLYNVDDALWGAVLERQDEADRVRTLRCLDAARRDERRTLRWTQLRRAGRVLAELPERLGG